jgi:putative ABC transport system permease protein
MKLFDLIATANRNLTRSKLRTLLTILAIFVGGFTLTLTTALNTGASEYLDRQLGNVSVPGIFQVMPKTELNPLSTDEVKEYDPNRKQFSIQSILSAAMTDDDVEKLKTVEGAETVTPYYGLAPEYLTRAGEKKYQVTQMTQYFGLNLDLAAGRLPTANDTNVVVLPESFLGPLNFSAEEAIGKELSVGYRNMLGQLTEQKVTVVGVMRKTFVTAGAVFVDVNTARSIAREQGQGARYIAIFVKFRDVTEETDEAILKARLQGAGNYTAISMEERVGTVITVVTAITTGLSVVGIIALLAASFGIINTLLMSVYERTKEIGLMKALGMRASRVFGLFAIEAALVGFWGSVIAVGAAWAASIFANSWASATFLKDFEGFVLLVVNPMNAAFVVGLIMTIAFLAGTLPALKASRLDPIEALRSE